MFLSSRGPGAFTMAAFATAVTLGGANFLAVRFSNRELEPTWGAALRFSVAAVLFTSIALALRLRWPRGRQLALTAVYGLLSIALFYALMYWALVRVTAGVATVVLAIVPLLTLLLASAQHTERLRGRAVVGSFLAFGGITWMTISGDDVTLAIGPLLALLGAALAISQSVIVGKKLSGHHPVMTNAVAVSAGAVALLVMSLLTGDQWAFPSQLEVIWSFLYLVTLGSVGLFVLILLIVRHWTASATSYMFVLFPIVTMLLGAWLADEPITAEGVVGALLVMSGVWFGALSSGAREPLTGARLSGATAGP